MNHSNGDRRAIEIVWSIGLLGALVTTVVMLKEVALVLRALREIHELARMTRDAAEGIARNVEPIAGLDAVAGPAGELDRHTQALARAAAAIEHKLGGLAPAPRGS
jgi:hypothetical protein